MATDSTRPTTETNVGAQEDLPSGPIAWMAKNRVAANLLMALCLAAGGFGMIRAVQEVFPQFDLDVINVTIPYPGASPAEVEQGIVFAVEEAVRGLEGVKRVNSVAAEGVGNVSVELLLGEDPDKVLSDVKNAVDRIQSFPEEAEKPTVAVATRRRQVISLVIAGDQDRSTLHALAERARAEILAHDDVTQVDVFGLPPLEVSIEIPRERLEAYGLTLNQVAQQVRASSIELPGGGLETSSGEILVRVADRRKTGSDFADIILKGTETGFDVRLGDIAVIKDTFADENQETYYNGVPAVRVTAYRIGNETPTKVATVVRNYADQLKAELPETVTIAIWRDDSKTLEARLDLLSRNAQLGLVLVLIILALFLKPNLAAWVAVGIPVSFLGAFVFLPIADVSINMVTTFAFIVTLGLVVDDAIIVGENIYAKTEEGMPPLKAAMVGASEMAMPVTFSILTTIAAFSPLLAVPGTMGKIFRLIPVVVISVLLMSWLESFFVLPAHLSHKSKVHWLAVILSPLEAVQERVSAGLVYFTANIYRPALVSLLRYRYVVAGGGFAVLILTGGVIGGGLVPFSFFPKIEGDRVYAAARLPFGAPMSHTRQIQRELEQSARAAIASLEAEQGVQGMFTLVGQGPAQRGPGAGSRGVGSHLVTVELGLITADKRTWTSAKLAAAWEDNLPTLPGVEAISIVGAGGPGAGAAVDVQLTHTDIAVLAESSSELTATLKGYAALTNIENTHAAGKPQVNYHLLPHARMLGLTGNEVARQLRGAFFGAEALREQRGRNEIKVMVRLPEDQRSSEHDLENHLIGTRSGGHVPLAYVARFERGRSPTAINREEGKRVVNVRGELAANVVSPAEVLASLRQDVLPKLRVKYPDLGLELVGAQRSQGETFAALRRNFVFAMFVIFALLAIPFRSYIQPIIVMCAIPFGIVGAVAGHAIMGFEMSLISLMGIIALSGVVVNDSLVLIDATNRACAGGKSPADAIVYGATRRLRPILLTSLTTAFGLLPMILERSTQARFLIPMAISLGFGVLFATVVVLGIVPAVYLIIEDIRSLFGLSADEVEAPAAPPTPAET